MAGLRERKKQQTRIMLSRAAIRLCVQRGWANVTVDDIAAEADVSPRTFRNYFGSKAEAIAASHLDRTLTIAAELRARPDDEPLWDALAAAVLSQYALADDSVGDPATQAALRLVLAEPELHGEVLKADTTAQAELARAIGERTGTTGTYPRLVAAVVGATTYVAIEHCLWADPPVPMGPLLRDLLAQVAAGLPIPMREET